MNQNKRKIKKYIFAAIMLIAVAYITVFIKDTLDAKNPEKSLPLIDVSVGYTKPTVARAGYEWHFGSKTVRSPFVSPPDVPMDIFEAMPGMPIVVNFSVDPIQVFIYQGVGISATEFSEKIINVSTPQEEGIYVYKIVANFAKGDIVYYFALDVKKQHTIS